MRIRRKKQTNKTRKELQWKVSSQVDYGQEEAGGLLIFNKTLYRSGISLRKKWKVKNQMNSIFIFKKRRLKRIKAGTEA